MLQKLWKGLKHQFNKVQAALFGDNTQNFKSVRHILYEELHFHQYKLTGLQETNKIDYQNNKSTTIMQKLSKSKTKYKYTINNSLKRETSTIM